ncbi:MAG: discoidin domain-containing protein, partial [Sedimentisphaerales bacterium]
STIFKGSVWQFTVEPIAYPIAGENITATASSSNAAEEGPENTINGSGLDADDLHSDDSKAMWLSSVIGPQPTWIQYEFDQVYKLHQMWVWNYNTSIEPVIGFGIKEAAIEYSTDGANWTTLSATHEFARSSGTDGYAHNTTVDLSGVVAKYIRITANRNWGGILNQYGLSEVRFFYVPVWARGFNPASGTTDMAVDNVTVSWRAGREAASHNLYFSTDQQAVIDETVGAVNIPADRSYVSYDTGALELEQNYYWKVNEVNETATPITWQGDVLSFSTQEYMVVDDFEDYNDFEPDRIFDTWIDGWGVATNGSQVGYADPPFAEQSIIHAGKQSMPFSYDNTAGAAYSEAARTFASPQDWTKHGIKTLVLYFHGNPTNSVGQLYVKLNNSKVVYGGDTAAMAKLRWQQWNIDLASVGANLQNITKLSIGIDGNGAKGTLYFDDIQLYRLAPEVVVSSEEVWIEAEAATTITEPMVIYETAAASGGKYIGTDPSLSNSNNNPPAPAGTASYTFAVAGGVYKLQFRVNIPSGDDSFWVRIPDATTQTANHSSGWVMFNGIQPGNFWHWDDVFSDDDPGNPTVQFTMPAGTYTLEIAYREAGAMLDVIVISKID